MKRSRTIYCSGPLFSPEEVAAMTQIGAVLEEAGYETFVPHRDGIERFVMSLTKRPGPNLPGASLISRKIGQLIFALDVFQVVERCDALVFNMNGRVPDEGAVAETAMAFAAGKPLVIYKNDARSTFNGHDNGMVTGLSYTCSTVGDVKSLPAELDRVIRLVEEAGGSPYSGDNIPPHMRTVLARGRGVWRFLASVSEPKTDEDVAALCAELARLADDDAVA